MPLIRAEFRRYRRLQKAPLLHDASQVAYWPFDRDNGSYARDRSGHAYHGTVYGASRAAGKTGDALNFDGVNDYVAVPHASSLDLKTSVTLTAWVYRTAAQTEWIINKNYEALTDTQYGFYFGSNNAVNFVLDGAARVNPVIDVIGRWAFVACTWDGSAAKVYVDGELKASASFSATLTTRPYSLTLACRKTTGGVIGTYWFKGVADEVRIFNRALSQAEIKRLMNMRVF